MYFILKHEEKQRETPKGIQESSLPSQYILYIQVEYFTTLTVAKSATIPKYSPSLINMTTSHVLIRRV